MAPLTTVTMFFAPHDGDVHGFGILFPARAGVRALGVLLNADILPGRSDVRSETWIVGDRDAALTAQPDAALREMLADDRRRLTGRDAAPLAAHITRWPAAIPVYGDAILDVARMVDELPPWLALAGNYTGRIGVAALLAGAEAAASRVAGPT
jgi:protoporphyrinogen oxidase